MNDIDSITTLVKKFPLFDNKPRFHEEKRHFSRVVRSLAWHLESWRAGADDGVH